MELGKPSINHPGLLQWIAEVVQLCAPKNVVWCDGSKEEYEAICDLMVQRGTLVRLNQALRPDSFLARSHASDVARLESRTFICSASEADAGPTNRWANPVEMKATLRHLFNGCMEGRTMYVIPFAMGPLDSPLCRIGIEVTDSEYVVASMRIMTHMGREVLSRLGNSGIFIPCLHSVGAPLKPGEKDVPWPCVTDPARKFIAHFPDDPSIWSFGSGYGGNALLGKKCLALRIASVTARREHWLAEHMVILCLTSPAGKKHYIAGAFPSACGKTNLAMMQPTLPGWRVTCIGDDIAWIRPGEDGRLYAVNPETGFFGVAPGTSKESNPNAIATLASNTIFTNVLLTAEGDVWWEGMGTPPPASGIDWEGKVWTPEAGRDGAHPNSRFTSPASQCPVIDPDWQKPEGVPLSAILFGGRRPTTVPLVNEAFDWEHGVFLGSSCGSETTAAAEGKTKVLRRDPFAMLPFCGYNMAEYFRHWLSFGKTADRSKLPRIYFVNWFRKDPFGLFLWPGFGENSRVLKWICERVEGVAEARATPIGNLPTADSMDLQGLKISRQTIEALLSVDGEGWEAEAEKIAAYYEQFGNQIPAELLQQLEQLRRKLGSAPI
jgi:phosphoenolpyruvate carboxykinase (GTP)